uniref:Peptidase C14 caspase domain-containing protein n=1 Tax=Thermosporothrix sp. COM3 TaxID=2490863 RepID=A0A455SXD2_9CHLR|nr:hypothetical protein KTC_63030 [Thermosporothrix sp. COM3]
MGRRLGLIIGINTYQDPTFQPLQFAENDARALAQWLVNNQGGKWSPGDVQVVQGQHATHELLKSLFTQTCLQVALPDDLVFLYFAGHTYIDERSGQGILAASNTSYQDPTTGIPLITIAQQLFAQSQAGQILFIIDSFQSGRLWSARRASPYDFSPLCSPAVTSALQQQPNRMLFFSCRGNEFAPETGMQKLGSFTHRLIAGLCGPANDPTLGRPTIESIYSFLQGSLSDQQKPQIIGQINSPVILAGDPLPDPSQEPVASKPQPQVYHDTPGSQYPQGASLATATTVRTQQNEPSSGPLVNHSALSAFQNTPTTDNTQAVTPMLAQAKQLVQANRLAEAIMYVEQALQASPQDTEALTLKAQVLGTMGRLQEAFAVIDQMLQQDPENALAWSMRAVVLNNAGQYQAALEAVERSLELNPNNLEAYNIKTGIMEHLATTQSQHGKTGELAAKLIEESNKEEGRTRPFWKDAALQIVGLLIGVVGIALPLALPGTLALAGLVVSSIGFALYCIAAIRGAYSKGIGSALLTIVLSVLLAALVGGAARFGLSPLIDLVHKKQELLGAIFYAAVALVAIAILAPVLAIGSFFVGIPRRRKGK